MSDDGVVKIDDLTIWVEHGSSVHLKIESLDVAVAELSGDQARMVAAALLRMADEADA